MWIFAAVLGLLSAGLRVYLNSLFGNDDSLALVGAVYVWLVWTGAIGMAVVLRTLNRLLEPDW